MRVLIVEDDKETSDYICGSLEKAGHSTVVAATGDAGLQLAVTTAFDVLVVDRMLPALDGLELIKQLREASVETPALCLTALGGVGDRVEGLGAGADDYLTKPFEMSELIARVNALARRHKKNAPTTIVRVADLEINFLTRRVTRAGEHIDLLPREYSLLEVLAQNAGRLVTRAMLLRHVWNFRFSPKTSLIETHISRLRAKIDRPFDVELIHTVRGRGYRLDEGR